MLLSKTRKKKHKCSIEICSIKTCTNHNDTLSLWSCIGVTVVRGIQTQPSPRTLQAGGLFKTAHQAFKDVSLEGV